MQAALRYAVRRVWHDFLVFARGEDAEGVPDG
jgi:hypothetical protein